VVPELFMKRNISGNGKINQEELIMEFRKMKEEEKRKAKMYL